MKRTLKRLVRALGYEIARATPPPDSDAAKVRADGYPIDFTDEEASAITACCPFTMTSSERLYALIHAVRYVAEHEIPGAIVECGVWKGGSMMAAAKTLLRLEHSDRHLYLFDTFEGMPLPGAADVSFSGTPAQEMFERTRTAQDRSDWCAASLQEVRAVMQATGYDSDKIHFVQGKVEETIPDAAPEQIALLRLDTDWYESTHHELLHLYPRLASGGVLILDDYGYWMGARKATDEFLAQNNVRLLLHRIDETGRMAVKP